MERYIAHCTTLYYTTANCTTLHYDTLHCTTLQYTTLHYTTLHCTVLHYTTLRLAVCSCGWLLCGGAKLLGNPFIFTVYNSQPCNVHHYDVQHSHCTKVQLSVSHLLMYTLRGDTFVWKLGPPPLPSPYFGQSKVEIKEQLKSVSEPADHLKEFKG